MVLAWRTKTMVINTAFSLKENHESLWHSFNFPRRPVFSYRTYNSQTSASDWLLLMFLENMIITVFRCRLTIFGPNILVLCGLGSGPKCEALGVSGLGLDTVNFIVKSQCWQQNNWCKRTYTIKASYLRRRAFAYAGPTSWNSLPDSLKDIDLTLQTFKRHLKTFLFSTY